MRLAMTDSNIPSITDVLVYSFGQYQSNILGISRGDENSVIGWNMLD